MPATAGRVRMPHNNRMSTSGALKTTAIWQKTIGHDPYAGQEDAGNGNADAAAAADKAQQVLEMAKKQNLTDGANRDDFSKRMFVGLKGGKKHAPTTNAVAASASAADPKALAALHEEMSSSEDEFVELDEAEDTNDRHDRKQEIKRGKEKKKRDRSSKKRRRKRNSSGSSSSSSDDESRRRERERRSIRKRDKRRKRREDEDSSSDDSSEDDSSHSSSSDDSRRRRRERKRRKRKRQERKRRRQKKSIKKRHRRHESECDSSDRLDRKRRERKDRNRRGEENPKIPSSNEEKDGQSSANMETFIACRQFSGSKEGYVFKNGNQGVGYYLDKNQCG